MVTGSATAVRLSDAVAKEIRIALIRADLKQAQLAERMGVSEMWVSRRLRGAQPIDLNDLQRFAEALGVPVSTLLPATVRPNDRSGVSPVRATPTPRTAATRPKGRPANASTRPQSSGPPTRRRPARIDRTGTR